MASPTAFWRRLSWALVVALVVLGWNLYVRVGYPKEWDRVRYGMLGTEVWSVCGAPTISSGGMKPDYWTKPFLFGQWEFHVDCGDVLGGQPEPVDHIELYYETFVTGKTWIKKYSPHTYIKDFQAYRAAFGFKPDGNSTASIDSSHQTTSSKNTQ